MASPRTSWQPAPRQLNCPATAVARHNWALQINLMQGFSHATLHTIVQKATLPPNIKSNTPPHPAGKQRTGATLSRAVRHDCHISSALITFDYSLKACRQAGPSACSIRHIPGQVAVHIGVHLGAQAVALVALLLYCTRALGVCADLVLCRNAQFMVPETHAWDQSCSNKLQLLPVLLPTCSN